ncbi:MAG: hypothetical protein F4Y50_08140 [Dehalococcoidia bacterium]|nr:hypothetical protein [Dehalococcoidia bacterium]
MQLAFNMRYWVAAVVAAVLSLAVGTVLAHEGREVGDYNIDIGWINEPAYEGVMNGIEIKVIKVVESGDDHHGESSATTDHHHGESSATDDHHGDSGAVKGLENTLQVEVTYVPTGASRVVNLSVDVDEPGRYTAPMLPTTPGVYEFRVFGAIEGMQVDETFASEGGGGDFDDIQPLASLQFPEELPSTREMESAVRGAISTAEEARDSADKGPGPLPIVALVFGLAGLVLGVAGLVVGLRRR